MEANDTKLGALMLLLFALLAYGFAPSPERIRTPSARARAAKPAVTASEETRLRLLLEAPVYRTGGHAGS